MLDLAELRRRQTLPLEDKITMTMEKINTWYEYWEGEVYITYSGGKDSTVLLHLIRQRYPDVKGVFVDTGLEYPEIRNFVKTIDNIQWIKPKMSFKRVLRKYGYPVVSKEISMAISRFNNADESLIATSGLWGGIGPPSKAKEYRLMGGKKGERKGTISKKWRYLLNAPFKISNECCNIMKKGPVRKIKGNPFIGILAYESKKREQRYVESGGCNMVTLKRPHSWPMAFWMEQDIWHYLRKYNIPYSPIYDMGYDRTGCMFCMFGVHMEGEPNRFQRMALTHPPQYKYCMEKLGLRKILSYMNIPYEPYHQTTLTMEV